jgi:hypothetical protein
MIRIYVWKKCAQSEMGHAAMEVRTEDVHRKFYVSWYPAEEVGFAAVFGKGEHCVTGRFYPSLENEIAKSWKGARPDLTLPIPRLNEDRIESEWKKVLDQGQWCLLGKNCAVVVYELMQAGGAPSVEAMDKYAADWDKRHSDSNPFTDDRIPGTQDDHLAGRVSKYAMSVWTPIRLYNYALAVRCAQVGFL